MWICRQHGGTLDREPKLSKCDQSPSAGHWACDWVRAGKK